MSGLTLSLCKECGDCDVEKARQILVSAGLSEDVTPRAEACLGPCDRPSVLALQSAGQAGYVFADVDLQSDADDIVATCDLYLSSENGWIEDARPCGRLRHLLVARMPG